MPKLIARFFLLLLAPLVLFSCAKEPETPVKIAINPWPGYEFLYLAKNKGFFKQVGLNMELVQLGSLSDSERAYLNGSVDGMASTLIEAVQAQVRSPESLKVIMVPDFSNGGDVIITRKEIATMADLKGKTVGCEVAGLGIFVLQRALSTHGLSLDDVTVVNTEQMRGETSMLAQKIDAFVSYPPVSIAILDHDEFHTVFTTAEIPNEIIDTVSVSVSALERYPDLPAKLMHAWQMSLDYFAGNQADAVAIMAKREGISTDDFLGTLGDLKILTKTEQLELFSQPQQLQTTAVEVCKTLAHVDALTANCDDLTPMIYDYP